MKILVRTPKEWEIVTGIVIMDPDGWRVDNKSFQDYIDEDEWNRRMMISTIMRAPTHG